VAGPTWLVSQRGLVAEEVGEDPFAVPERRSPGRHNRSIIGRDSNSDALKSHSLNLSQGVKPQDAITMIRSGRLMHR